MMERSGKARRNMPCNSARQMYRADLGRFALAVLAFAGSSLALGEPNDERACVVVALPSAIGIEGDAGEFSQSLREMLMSYLDGPSLRVETVGARLPSQAVEAARQSGCGHVLLTTITRERNEGSRFGRALQQAAGSAIAQTIPFGGSTADAVVRGATVAGGYAISDMARTSKARDEVTLEYRVGVTDDVLQATPGRKTAKARSDGEDLLTPLVEAAAEAIAAEVLGK